MSTPLTPALLFKTLADETRWRISQLIAAEGELCVCELTTALLESQPKISRHLAQMRRSGLLQDRRNGLWVYYRLHPQLPEWAQQMLQLTVQANQPWLAVNSVKLKNMRNRSAQQNICA